MPRLVLMTWVPTQKRWKKMHKGTMYFVSCGQLNCVPTIEGSLQAANEWWKAKVAELEGRKAEPATSSAVSALLSAWAGKSLETTQEAETAVAEIMEHYRHEPPPQEVIDAVLGKERHEQLRTGVDGVLSLPSPDQEKTVAALVALWLLQQKDRIKKGKVGLARENMNKLCLNHFVAWIGAGTAVETIDEMKWMQWHSHLAARVDAKIWAVSHVDRIYSVSKRFVRFLWTMRLVDLPRNLDNSDFSFSVSAKKIVTWSTEEIKRLRAVATGQTALHVLLMLNCGFIGKDIADLRHDEIDWKEGVITRKRSKTKAADNVPVVRYKLWAETFELLKQYGRQDDSPVLLTTTGRPWIETSNDGEFHHSDKVGSNFKYWMKRAKITGKPPKALRATGASMLAEHPQYKFYAQYYLGQSPKTIADKHYVKPNEDEYFKALAWLRTALGIGK